MKYIVQHPLHGDDFQKLSTLADRKDSPESTFKRAEREGDSNDFQRLSHDEDGIKPAVKSDSKPSRPEQGDSFQRLSDKTKMSVDGGKGVQAPSRPEQGDTFQDLSSEDADEERAGEIYKKNPRPSQGDTFQHLASYKSFEARQSAVSTEELDSVLKGFLTLVKAQSNGDKTKIRQLRSLISDMYSHKDKDVKDVKKTLWEEGKSYNGAFKDRKDFNLFVGKSFGGLKKFNVTKYKQLLKALVSHTTGKRKDEE